MTRELTNFIRFILDNFIPPILRGNKYFMYPAFYIWFKGKNVNKLMNFKSNLDSISEEEYINFYKIYDPIVNRKTDLNQVSLDFIIEHLKGQEGAKIIDIGCGNGYVLGELKNRGFTNLTGSDIIYEIEDPTINFVQGNIESLPFENDEFDIVICNHCIEHIINSTSAVSEIKRVAKLKLIVSTPKQVYNKYTFDLHVNFYPQRIDIISLMNMSNYKLIDNNGDWSFVGYK